MAANFDAILNTAVEDIVPPKPIPAGSYIASLGVYKNVKRKKEGEEIATIEFPINLINIYTNENGQDVDEETLADYGGVQAVRKNKRLTYAVWFEDDDDGEKKFLGAMGKLRKFLMDVAGIEGSSVKELLSNSRNAQIGVIIGHKLYQDQPQARIVKVFKLED